MKWMIVAWLGLWASLAGAQEISHGRLVVSGSGQIDSAPDMAMITMGVTATADSAAEALSISSATTGEMLTLLSEIGVEQQDMQTSDLSLSPLWNNRVSSTSSPPRITGYQAGNRVTVRVRSLGDLGAILDDIVASGANHFHGLQFGLQNPQPVQDGARRAAVADAIRKAQLYASAAGVELGGVLELSDTGAAPAPAMMERMAMSAPVPIAEGEVTTRAQVTMIFAIRAP